MEDLEHKLTPGYVARHVPPASNVGPDVALLDIAQDFLLARLHDLGLFEGVIVFKGGTALRKLYAGGEGRFSTDLDLATAGTDVDPATAADLVAEAIDGTRAGPFSFSVTQARGRWRVHTNVDEFSASPPPMKLDVGPPCWLEPEVRGFAPVPIHRRYGFQLPGLQVMRLEENLSEKIARLNRVATARDASDLVWMATTSPHSQLDQELIRRLSVLKVWVDNHGMNRYWDPALGACPLDVVDWLSPRDHWDDQGINLLAQPPPDLRDLEQDLFRYYRWLADLDEDEAAWAAADAGDRGEVVQAIADLPYGALDQDYLWMT